MVSTIEVTPTAEVQKPRAKARPTRTTKAEMRTRMAKVRAAKTAKSGATEFQCSKCKRTFENQHGLNVHNARPGRFHAKRTVKATNGKARITPTKSPDLANLQTKWMALAADARGAVRETLMECVIDLRLALRG